MNIFLQCSDCGEKFEQIEMMIEIMELSGNDCISCPVCESKCFIIKNKNFLVEELIQEIG